MPWAAPRHATPLVAVAASLPGASGLSSAPVTTSRRTATSAVQLHYEWSERSWHVLGRVAKEDAIARPMPVLG